MKFDTSEVLEGYFKGVVLQGFDPFEVSRIVLGVRGEALDFRLEF